MCQKLPLTIIWRGFRWIDGKLLCFEKHRPIFGLFFDDEKCFSSLMQVLCLLVQCFVGGPEWWPSLRTNCSEGFTGWFRQRC